MHLLQHGLQLPPVPALPAAHSVQLRPSPEKPSLQVHTVFSVLAVASAEHAVQLVSPTADAIVSPVHGLQLPPVPALPAAHSVQLKPQAGAKSFAH